MGYDRKDAFYRKAKREGERSRAAYKLVELNQKFRLFKHGDRVLDVGAFPGGWSQVAGRAVGGKGRVVGIDLVPIEPVPEKNVLFLQGDATAPDTPARLREALGGDADCVLSDASPKLSGVRDADAARVSVLVDEILTLAFEIMAPGANFVAKVFSRATPHELVARCKGRFAKVKLFRPEATRKESSEIYLIALGYRGKPAAPAPPVSPGKAE
ncbi:MAG: RlmE family RNA methyltransferase [Bdellovibrionota bacterium]